MARSFSIINIVLTRLRWQIDRVRTDIGLDEATPDISFLAVILY